MTREPIRDPRADHLLTPENCALAIVDFQPVVAGHEAFAPTLRDAPLSAVHGCL